MLAAGLALVPPMIPKVERLPRLTHAPLVGAAPTLGALLPAVTASPAFADDGGGLGDTILNVVLTGAVGFFVLFIGQYLVEALAEVGSQAPERLDRLGMTGGGGNKDRESGAVRGRADQTLACSSGAMLTRLAIVRAPCDDRSMTTPTFRMLTTRRLFRTRATESSSRSKSPRTASALRRGWSSTKSVSRR